MSEAIFTIYELNALRSNPNTKGAGFDTIRFTSEFKQHVRDELERGVDIRDIFEEAGYDTNVVGTKRMNNLRNAVLRASNAFGPGTRGGGGRRASISHARLDVLTDRVRVLEDAMLESAEKDESVPADLKSAIEILTGRIDTLETRLRERDADMRALLEKLEKEDQQVL